jgi:hypothetical protein
MASIINSSLIADVRGSVGNLTYSANRGGPYVKSRSLGPGTFTTKQAAAETRFQNASLAWYALNDFDYTEWVAFSRNFTKSDFNQGKRKWTPKGLFIACHQYRQQLGLTGNPSPVMPGNVGFTHLEVSRTTANDYLFTTYGGASNSDYGTLYYTSHPRSQAVRSINTTQQIWFCQNDYIANVAVDKRGTFDVGFPGEWPTTPSRFWASVRVIHKESGVCVGHAWDDMTWPLLLPNGLYGISEIFSTAYGTNLQTFQRIVPSNSGYFLSVSVYISFGTGLVDLGIYNEVGGVPATLLVSSGLVATPSVPSWVSFTFASELPFLSNVPYYIAMASSGPLTFRRNDVGAESFVSTVANNTLQNPAIAVQASAIDVSLYASVFNVL